jgi:ferredoxin
MVKVRIKRDVCIGCGACGAIASSVFVVPSGEKSLLKGTFKIVDKDKGFEIKEGMSEEELLKISQEVGESTIEGEIEENLKEDAKMGEEACPVQAIELVEK